MFLLTSTNAAQILGDAGMTVLIGFTVVFSVLLLLTGIFWLFGVTMSAGKKKKECPFGDLSELDEDVPPVYGAPVEAPIVGNTEPVATKPEVDGGIPEETVAAISAAVAAVAPQGSQYAVRGIRKL
ncbi:MAG: OadG family protein [Clostridia bacterium]|nr:OadG family protein [Clostridia bacterium]